MRRALPDGLEVDDDVARVDLDVLHRYLSEESYWAAGRTRATSDRLAREATRVVAIYDGDAMVAYCRVMSDEATIALLFDVFVLSDYRGRGLGKALMREAVELSPQRDLPWHLGTRDAHELYRKFGFGLPNVERQMLRPGHKRT
jgi:GNAT superfamily N-acetyltransferase